MLTVEQFSPVCWTKVHDPMALQLFVLRETKGKTSFRRSKWNGEIQPGLSDDSMDSFGLSACGFDGSGFKRNFRRERKKRERRAGG